ncbi:Stress-response A/B barrel domain-containing protein UP3 isoform A [Senna tora]|uniref:Stress-response A/B barrel domain-containing protein UP3 isoform A n=1 Tax=Senna tora TaxID=362788 RepID=A0A834TTN9_9FABA|nr:Stress-response A/B barrel domain-containing protein UP3 isoform A [Senna tora]
MLDYLYTTQYQMGGIVAISVGRISAPNPENYTHALYMRFQRKENLEKFYENPFFLKVLKEHVLTYCHGLINVDYESEVEDDMLSIFRKGEEFNYGVEFVLLISFINGVSGETVEHALTSLAYLTLGSPSLIVQSTQGLNFNSSSMEYTHGVVIRFRSVEAFEIFMGSKEYKDMWQSKFQPLVQKALVLNYSVDPVGTEIM